MTNTQNYTNRMENKEEKLCKENVQSYKESG